MTFRQVKFCTRFPAAFLLLLLPFFRLHQRLVAIINRSLSNIRSS